MINPNLGSVAFALEPGQSMTFDFFSIAVQGIGGAVGEVTASLAFDDPSGITVTGSGAGAFVTLRGLLTAGMLGWANAPWSVTSADGSQFTVAFSDVSAFGLGNSAQITATVSSLAAASVDEPSIAGLLLAAILSFIALQSRGTARFTRYARVGSVSRAATSATGS
jgi:hypothetical protein